MTVALGALAAVTLALSVRNPADRPHCSKQQRKTIRKLARRVQGVVVYQRADGRKVDGIYKTYLGSPESILLVKHGRYPRWSPDGRHIAFLRDNQVMLMTANGGQLRQLATAGDSRAIAYHPNGEEVLFTDGDQIRAVSVKTGAMRTLVDGYAFRALDMSTDGCRLAASAHGHRMLGFDLPEKRRWDIGRGCSANLSPDGSLFSSNTSRHLRFAICRWGTGEMVGSLDAPAGLTTDNEYWSNHQNWLVCRTAYPNHPDTQNIIAHSVFENRSVQVTFSNDCDRPDLFVFSESAGRLAAFRQWLRIRLRI